MTTAPGWYADPASPERMRWWDGQQWTEHTQELSPAASMPQQPSFAAGGDLWLPPQMVEFGYLPHVCVRHGRPATTMQRAPVYSRTPAWVIPLALFSLLIGLLIALAVRETVWGPWPVCDRCLERREQYRRAMWACLVGSVLAVAGAIAFRAPALLLLGIPLIAAAIVLRGLSDWYRVTSSSVDRGRTAVHVRSPAAAFVRALSRPAMPQRAFATHLGLPY